MPATSYRECLRAAHREALQRDPRVFVMGEDVGLYGGTYAVTKGLLAEFGEDRVRDAPLSELGFVAGRASPCNFKHVSRELRDGSRRRLHRWRLLWQS